MICIPVLVLFDSDWSHFHHLRDRCRVHLQLQIISASLCRADLTHRLFRQAINLNHFKESEGYHMISWAIGLFIVAIVAAVFGFGGIAGSASSIAQIIFFVFLVLAAIAFIRG